MDDALINLDMIIRSASKQIKRLRRNTHKYTRNEATRTNASPLRPTFRHSFSHDQPAGIDSPLALGNRLPEKTKIYIITSISKKYICHIAE